MSLRPHRTVRELLKILLKRQARLERRLLRDPTNPFTLPQTRFRKLFGFPPLLAKEFIDELSPLIKLNRQYSAQSGQRVPHHLQILCVLNFFTTGSYQRPLGRMSLFWMITEDMAMGYVEKICHTIEKYMYSKYVSFPYSNNQAIPIKEKFKQSTGLPGVVGIIDGFHIPFTGYLPTRVNDYYNTLGYYSLLCLIVCDADSRVIFCDPRYVANCTEWTALEICKILKSLERIYRQDPQTWLLGDLGYQMTKFTVVPFQNPVFGIEEKFNEVHERVRSQISRCWAMMRGQWKCLSNRDKPINCNHDNAIFLVHSVCVCHNYLLSHNVRPHEADLRDPLQPPTRVCRKRPTERARNHLMYYIADHHIQ
ncbi:putative nuclease HARBI1 [Phlebotomus papatasi]|uniref:putative nuclease HARBI1 n=1 Tax=Phlebotomus papatasi TaxID=29031 RepID=UPI0024836C22|nr:putative nuclease HARBI1 [Phlebotomus papatasi]